MVRRPPWRPNRADELDLAGSRPRITVIGLGPAGPDLLTAGTLAAIASHPHRYLRTSRHPAAVALGEVISFDEVYEQAASFEEVYADIVERLVDAAQSHGFILYAVPGSPAVAERTVELLRRDDRIELDVLPAMSFVDLTWVRLGVDPLTARPRIVDGHRFAVDAAGDLGPFLVTQCHSAEILSSIKLAFDTDAPPTVTVLARLGLADESITELAWHELDRVEADHLTSLWIPRLATPLAGAIVSLEAVMRSLRNDCPWDREQTHLSLAPYAPEEAAELVEALQALAASGNGDLDDASDVAIDHVADELGDILFQVLFHSCLAAERGWFTLADVMEGLSAKLVRRHPHVFPPEGSGLNMPRAETAEDVRRQWLAIKASERAAPPTFLPDR